MAEGDAVTYSEWLEEFADNVERNEGCKNVMSDISTPCFGIWTLSCGITLRIFYRLFQIKLVRDELYSQRNDSRRIRFMGLSIKLFGK